MVDRSFCNRHDDKSPQFVRRVPRLSPRQIGTLAILCLALWRTGGSCFIGRAADKAPHPENGADSRTDLAASRAGLLAVTGRVLMPDGSPAAGATVRIANTYEDPSRRVARTDTEGRFRLEATFRVGCPLHASSEDGHHQTTRWIPPEAVREAARSPIDLTFEPADSRVVTVTAAGKPVEGANVVATGLPFFSSALTGRDGKALLRLPAGVAVQSLVAFHPQLGMDGKFNDSGVPPNGFELSLHPPRPYTIRVVDTDANAVAGVGLAFSVRTGADQWIDLRSVEAAQARTNAEGLVIVPWMTREKLAHVEVDVTVGSDWKIDQIDDDLINDGTTTVQVRRLKTILGRLVMPAGADPEGILIKGFGFGPGANGDVPGARVRRDGWFALRVASEHGYVLGVLDDEWATDMWCGLILESDAADPSRIILNGYPSRPVTIRVTKGPKRTPIEGAALYLTSRGSVEWADREGKERSGIAGVSRWLKTDARGEARGHAGLGPHEVGVWIGEKHIGEQKFEISGDKPAVVEFHRK